MRKVKIFLLRRWYVMGGAIQLRGHIRRQVRNQLRRGVG